MAVADLTPEWIVPVDERVGLDGQSLAHGCLGRPPAFVDLRLDVTHDRSRPHSGKRELPAGFGGCGAAAGAAADPDV